jgi:hypothetical protein
VAVADTTKLKFDRKSDLRKVHRPIPMDFPTQFAKDLCAPDARAILGAGHAIDHPRKRRSSTKQRSNKPQATSK